MYEYSYHEVNYDLVVSWRPQVVRARRIIVNASAPCARSAPFYAEEYRVDRNVTRFKKKLFGTHITRLVWGYIVLCRCRIISYLF